MKSPDHLLQFLDALGDVVLELAEVSQDFLRRIVFDFLVFDFLVAVDGEIVLVFGDLGLGDEEGLLGAGTVGLGVAVLPALQNVGEVGGFLLGPFVVEGEAVGLHVVEPDLFGTARIGLGEKEDGGGDTGVGLEDARGHGDDAVQFLVLDEGLAQVLVGLGGAEEDAVGHDDCRPPAHAEEAEKEGEEEELGLLGLDYAEEVLGGGLVVEATREGGIGEDEGVGAGVVGMGFLEGILVADVGALDAVEHHVHAPDAEHGGIEIKAMKDVLGKALAGGFVGKDLGLVVLAQVFPGGHEEPAGSAGGVADDVGGGGCGHLHHQIDDVAGGAELPVLPGGCDLAQHVLVDVALEVAVVHGELVEPVDDVGEQAGGGHNEEGLLHVRSVEALGPAEVLDEGKDLVAHEVEERLGGKVAEAGPAQVLSGGARSGGGVGPVGEDGVLDGGAEPGGFFSRRV